MNRFCASFSNDADQRGRHHQPAERQPVMLKYLEKLFTVTTSSPNDSADTGAAS